MHGTGPVGLGREVVYAHYTEGDGVTHVRLSVDEWDRLGLHEGQRVAVALPERPAADELLVAAVRVPPFVWLELEPLGPAAARPVSARLRTLS